MPRLIAIEWDNREARVLVGNERGKAVVFEQAFQIPWTLGEDGKPPEGTLPTQLAAGLSTHAVRRGEALVAVSRNSVELKSLVLPAATDDELPEMVRWQAQREFHSIAESWPLDYVPLSAKPGEPRTVLAAALSPELARQIITTCESTQLRVEQLALRSCAAASCFLRSRASGNESVRLLVDLLGDDAELVAIVDQDVVFLRTARLRGDVQTSDEAVRGLISEIRRTLAALSNQLSGRRVEAIYLCGTDATHSAVAQRIGTELSLTTAVFDPWLDVEVDASLRRQMPNDPGRFAALIGLLTDQASDTRPAIDFLHPRRSPPPPSKRRTLALAGAAAGVLIVGLVGTLWYQLYSLDARIAELRDQLRRSEPLAKAAAEQEKAASAIDAWLASDVTWLDELERLNAKLPESRDVMLSHLRLSADSTGGGTIQFEGHVREPQVVDTLERALRDERHRVEGQGRNQEPKDRYAWQFKTFVSVKPGEENATSQPASSPSMARAGGE